MSRHPHRTAGTRAHAGAAGVCMRPSARVASHPFRYMLVVCSPGLESDRDNCETASRHNEDRPSPAASPRLPPRQVKCRSTSTRRGRVGTRTCDGRMPRAVRMRGRDAWPVRTCLSSWGEADGRPSRLVERCMHRSGGPHAAARTTCRPGQGPLDHMPSGTVPRWGESEAHGGEHEGGVRLGWGSGSEEEGVAWCGVVWCG